MFNQFILVKFVFVFRKYPVLRRTSYRDISYYVKDNFHTDYSGDLRRLEHTIEEDYLNIIRTKCIREKEYCM